MSEVLCRGLRVDVAGPDCRRGVLRRDVDGEIAVGICNEIRLEPMEEGSHVGGWVNHKNNIIARWRRGVHKYGWNVKDIFTIVRETCAHVPMSSTTYLFEGEEHLERW